MEDLPRTVYQLVDDDGRAMDARLELQGSSVVFHSRGGRKGTPSSTNADYGPALRLLLQRLKTSGFWVEGVWVESRATTKMPEPDRRILYPAEFTKSVDEMFTWLSARMRGIGSTNGQGGNSTKRIRLSVLRRDDSPSLLSVLGVRRVTSVHDDGGENDADIELSDEERQWAEGDVRLTTHLRRERAHGLSDAKKRDFREKYGHLFCEECGMDPVKEYEGSHGEACIEVHHAAVSVGKMAANHKTKLADLKCLCANCHRVLHRLLKAGVATSDKKPTLSPIRQTQVS